MAALEGNTHLFEEGLGVYKKYWKEIYVSIGLVALALIGAMALMMLAGASSFLGKDNLVVLPFVAVLVTVGYIATFLVGFGAQVGLTKIALDAVNDKKPEYRDLYRHFRRIPSYVFTNYLTIFITYIGLFLLIIPGFVLFARYQLAGVFVVDRGVGLSEALSLSDKATKGNIWRVIKFDIFLFLLNLLVYIIPVVLAFVGLGSIAMIGFLGFIFTVPLTLVSFIVMYKKLSVGI